MPDEDYFERLKERFGLSPDKTREDLQASLRSPGSAPEAPTVQEILHKESRHLATYLFDSFRRLNLNPAEQERVSRLRSLIEVRSLKDNEIEWLAQIVWRRGGPRYLLAIVARFWQDRSSYTRDPGYLTRASSCWRDAHLPEQSLACLENAPIGADKRLTAVILTCRAAAQKDLGELEAAETNANEAISLNESDPHPYNVLGAVFYRKRMFDIGDAYFTKANERGGEGAPTRREIEEILEDMNWSEKQAFAKHLLGVDPRKHAWVLSAIH